jgi:hypothetical protein
MGLVVFQQLFHIGLQPKLAMDHAGFLEEPGHKTLEVGDKFKNTKMDIRELALSEQFEAFNFKPIKFLGRKSVFF